MEGKRLNHTFTMNEIRPEKVNNKSDIETINQCRCEERSDDRKAFPRGKQSQ